MGIADWALKLARRVMALEPGRYIIHLDISNGVGWQVIQLDKVKLENGKRNNGR